MSPLPKHIEQSLRQYLEKGKSSTDGKICHTRSGNRGGVLRLPLGNSGSVVLKFWHMRNIKEQIKSAIYISNGWREWCMHQLIYRKGILVPEPLYFHRLTLSNGERYEIMGIEDLGEVESSLIYLKRLIDSGNKSAIMTFENDLISVTEKIVSFGIVDIDHQLNNFLIDNTNRLIRIDFECAQRPWSKIAAKGKLAEMIARLLTSHAYAVQPDIQRTKCFATQLYKQLHVDQRMRSIIQLSVNKKLQKQHPQQGVVSAITLPN